VIEHGPQAYRGTSLVRHYGKKSLSVLDIAAVLKTTKDANPGLPEVEDARKRLAGVHQQAVEKLVGFPSSRQVESTTSVGHSVSLSKYSN
jgi:hypothetical protein